MVRAVSSNAVKNALNPDNSCSTSTNIASTSSLASLTILVLLLLLRRDLGASLLSVTDVLVEPTVHFIVPLDRVLCLQNPVVLIGEVEEATGDILGLQSVEGAQAMSLGETIVWCQPLLLKTHPCRHE